MVASINALIKKSKSSDFMTNSIQVYRFVIATTTILLILFLSLFLFFKIWIPILVLGAGIFIVTPTCWLLAHRGNPLKGRILFITACNIYVYLCSLITDHSIDAQYFFISISTAAIVLFRKEEKTWSFLLVFFSLFFWFLTQFDAHLFLPPELISTNLPTALFQNLCFVGSLFLSVSYLYFHIESIRSHYQMIQNNTEELGKEKFQALELLTKIANNVPGAVYQYRLSPDGHSSFPYSSLGMKMIYHLNPEDIQNDASLVFKTIHPDDMENVVKTINLSAKNLEPWMCDYRVHFPDGSIEWRRGIAQPQKESDGSILWHGFIMDISNEKKLETDLKDSQRTAIHAARLASLGEMAGGFAHEINNPLMIITSKTDFIEQILTAKEPQIDKAITELEKIRKTTFRIAGIVKGLLTFARGGDQIEFQKVNLEQIKNDVLPLCIEKAKSEGVDLQFFFDGKKNILGNSIQISQVLLNLINNSLDAISTNDTKWVRVEAQEISDKKVIQFSVTDSGLGLNPQQIEKLMQPFFTTKGIGKGTGLGLSISKGLIEAHGGHLTYDRSSLNTRFYFEIKSFNEDGDPNRT